MTILPCPDCGYWPLTRPVSGRRLVLAICQGPGCVNAVTAETTESVVEKWNRLSVKEEAE